MIILLKDFSKELFNREFNIKERIKNKKSCYYMLMDSKSIFNLLSISFKIPSGKKSHIVKVPDLIINSTKKIKSAFLLGIIFTEGGNRKRGLGLSTASENLWQGLIDLFLEIGFKLKKDKWIYKKYKKEYYGLSFKKEEFNRLIAGVPEWSNGRDLGGVLSYYKNKWNL